MGEPVRNFAINANEIVLPTGGVRLWFEIQLGGWAPERLQTWQATIDPASYSSGLGADLHPAVERCLDSSECATLFGPGSPCTAGHCVAGWQDTQRGDFVVQGGISAVRTTSLEYTYGSTVAPFHLPIVDDGIAYYGGTLVIDVPEDAAGTYELRFRNDGATFLLNSDDDMIFPVTTGSMRITLPSACCFADSTCSDAPPDCKAAGGVAVASCGGDCDGNRMDDSCELLQGGADCNGNRKLDVCDVPWDADGNGIVTRDDYGLLSGCMNPPCGAGLCGPGAVAAEANSCCSLADVDQDGDIDLKDFAELEVFLAPSEP